MCGIIGSINFKLSKESLDSIEHRGPDGRGWYSEGNVNLGHVRLSILDTSENGKQPYYSSDENLIMVFNGEIYNHWEIREQLERSLADYNSTSDTETILQGYLEIGKDIFNKLNGIFSIAIYDKRNKEIVIVRDRFGVKPLYYTFGQDSFQFCSELKGLKPKDKTINIKATSNYIRFLWSPGEDTLFSSVKKLLPGKILTISTSYTGNVKWDQIKKKSFDGKRFELSETDLVDKAEELLTKAVERQLLSDVPVGFFLSGGLDSSLIVALARKIRPNEKIQCFTINTTEFAKSEGFSNDLDYAKIVASHLDVDLEIVEAKPDILKEFDKMIWLLDEPQADPAPLNVYNISKRAKHMGYKVLLGGAGGDDVFSGYRRHQILKYARLINKVPQFILTFIAVFKSLLNPSTPQKRRLLKVLSTLDKPKNARLFAYFEWLEWKKVKGLFNRQNQKLLENLDEYSFFRQRLEEIPLENEDLNKMLHLEMSSFLVDHNFNYTDKMGMAAGVEIRVPFLDNDLVDFSYQLPSELKLNNGETKYILRKVAERYLPLDVIYRSKAGFGAPVRKWITEDLSVKIDSRLDELNINNQGLFDYEKVKELIDQNKAGQIDASYSIWAVLAIDSWLKQFKKDG